VLLIFLWHDDESIYLPIDLLLLLIFQLGAAACASYVAGILKVALNPSYPVLPAPFLHAEPEFSIFVFVLVEPLLVPHRSFPSLALLAQLEVATCVSYEIVLASFLQLYPRRR